MANHQSTASFSKAIKGYGGRLQNASRDAVNDAALVVKTSILAQVARTTGGDMKLGNWGAYKNVGKGYPLSIGYDIKGNTGRVVALVKPRGAIPQWYLLEYGAKPHTILPRGTGRVKGKRTAANRRAAKQDLYNALFGGAVASPLLMPDGPRSVKVKHPGAPAKRPFKTGVEVSRNVAEKIIANQYLRALRKAG